jgi:hypothetical protein
MGAARVPSQHVLHTQSQHTHTRAPGVPSHGALASSSPPPGHTQSLATHSLCMLWRSQPLRLHHCSRACHSLPRSRACVAGAATWLGVQVPAHCAGAAQARPHYHSPSAISTTAQGIPRAEGASPGQAGTAPSAATCQPCWARVDTQTTNVMLAHWHARCRLQLWSTTTMEARSSCC